MNPYLWPLFSATVQTSFQAVFIVLLVMVIRFGMGERLSAGWRYGIWLVLMLQLAVPWRFEFDIGLYRFMAGFLTAGMEEQLIALPGLIRLETVSQGIKTMPGSPAGRWLSLIWAAGAVFMFAVALARSMRFLRAVQHHDLVVCEKTLKILEACKKELGIKTVIGLVETDLVSGPVLFGYLRPRILIPAGMIRHMDEKDIRLVFFHELMHLKHHDIFIGLAGYGLLCLHWFNPFIWLAFYRMKQDREPACDASVLSCLDASEHRGYGLVLLRFAGRDQTPLPGIAGIPESRSNIRRRIEMICTFKKRPFRYTLLSFLCVTLLGITALTGADTGINGAKSDLEGFSDALVTALAKKEYGKVTAHFDAAMAQALPQEKLKATWENLVGKAGEFKGVTGIRQDLEAGYRVCLVSCRFAGGPLDIKFVFNPDAEISGLWVLPPKNP